MITKIGLTNFKSFAGGNHILPLGPLTLIVGSNASGKSNLRDAIRLLHGIARGYSLAEIFGEKYGEGGVLQWKGLRGGAREAVNGMKNGMVRIDCDIKHTTKTRVRHGDKIVITPRHWTLHYEVEIQIKPKNATAYILNEELVSSQSVVFSTRVDTLKVDRLDDGKQIIVRARKQGSKKFIGPTLKLRQDHPLVSQLADHPDAAASAKNPCRALMEALSSLRFLDLDPQALRRPSLPGQDILGDKGENLSSVLQSLCENPDRRAALIEWIRELTPLDVVDINFEKVNLEGRIQLALKESGDRLVTAESASDGTLRFLAYAAAMLGEKPAATYFFEEIENGIHPNRVHLLLDLLQQATTGGSTQVIATTHSPALLNSLRGKALDDALLVNRSGGGSIARPLRTLPITPDDKSTAGDLLESGWFENATAFLDAENIENEQNK